LASDERLVDLHERAERLAEAAVLKEFPDSVILRPSLVFGPEDQLFNRFAAMARFLPSLPLLGGGRTKFQPVNVGNVAAAIAAAYAGSAQAGTIYELGGPEMNHLPPRSDARMVRPQALLSSHSLFACQAWRAANSAFTQQHAPPDDRPDPHAA
jgi:uncharacterized protein YbjT (DUF2867 family)